MSKFNTLFHKLKAVVGYSIAIIVIVSALGVSGVRLLLTTANLYQHEVEQLASSILQQPVKIGRMDAKLSGLVPTLIFHDIQILSEKTKKSLFSLTRIDVGLLFEDLLWEQKITPTQLTIRGMDVQVTRTVEGDFKIKGVDLEGFDQIAEDESNPLFEKWLLQQGEIGLEDSTFTWKDEQNAGLTWFFNDVNFLFKKTQKRQQLILSGELPKILGDKIKIAFDLEGDIASPESWKLKTFVESKKINLKPLHKYIETSRFKLLDGNAELKMWVDWQYGKLNHLSGKVNLNDFAYQLSKKEIVTLKRVSGIFDSYVDKNKLWNVSVEKFNYENNNQILNQSKFSLAFNYNGKKIETFYVKANHMKLDVISKIATDNHFLNKKNETLLNNLNIQGDVRNFNIAWKNNELYKLKTDFSGLTTNSWELLPKIRGLSGNVVYEQQKGNVSLYSKNSIIGFPRLFRDDFKFSNLNTDIIFSNTKQGFLFNVKDLKTENAEVSAISSAKLWIPKDGTSPHLDLQAYILRGDVAKVSTYLPVGIMEKYLVKWLDKALVGGKIEKGTVVFNGKINDFPFADKKGVFSASVEISDLIFNYRDNWPIIKNAKINANFTGQGLDIHLLTGNAENNQIYDSRAIITSFIETELQLDLAVTGKTENTIKYLANSPILPEAKNIINSTSFLGHIDTKIKINIPLDDITRKKKSLSYSGSAVLRKASLLMLEDKLDITEATGKLFFTENKFSSENLKANVLGEKATLSVTSSVKNKKIKISAKGKIKPGIILKRFNIPGAKKVSGNTTFKASMIFPGKRLKNSYPTLNITSNLLGIKSSLPEHFFKNKKTRQEFNFKTIFLDDNKIQFDVGFGNKGSAIVELDQSGEKTYLTKGAISISDTKAVLPGKNILYVDGSIKKITPSKWAKDYDFSKGKIMQSYFDIPIVINLDELGIITSDEAEDENDTNTSNPNNIPEFSGIINKLHYGKIFLGRLDFKVSQKEYGLHLDELYLSAKNMTLFAHGDWNYSDGKHNSVLDFTLSSDDFGGMLTDLDFSAIIQNGKTQAGGKIYWQGSPTQFSLNKLNGNIQLKIEDGNIKEVEAGAGRLLGLFSLSALPRKLFGDFKDTFKSGFNFDTAKGEMKIEKGDVYTDNFEINSSVAKITLSGRSGLAARDYDNTFVVIPNISGGAAGLTALLVNLPAGIGLWLIDKVTGEQFNKATARTYEISGSWDKPKIELLEVEESL